MADKSFLSWPFFDASHRALSTELTDWLQGHQQLLEHGNDVDNHCRRIVAQLGGAGFLKYCSPPDQAKPVDVRSLCIVRETLSYHSGLADFSFAMQCMCAGPIALYGHAEMRKQVLPLLAEGKAIGAFAISEAGAGSDVGAMKACARSDGNSFIISGEKTWISNAGIADHYVVFCRYPENGEKSFIALLVHDSDPGFSVPRRIDLIAPHPIGTLRFENCRVPASRLIGEPGKGLRVALGTLDVLRSTVGAAALGFARRALDEAIRHCRSRQVFGRRLADQQLTQARLAEMATAIDASALLIYRAAWTRDSGAERITREAAMAKLYATESAQRVIDDAVQLLGARGVVGGEPVEQLYREIRALRIYEGTSEIQKLVIATQVLND